MPKKVRPKPPCQPMSHNHKGSCYLLLPVLHSVYLCHEFLFCNGKLFLVCLLLHTHGENATHTVHTHTFLAAGCCRLFSSSLFCCFCCCFCCSCRLFDAAANALTYTQTMIIRSCVVQHFQFTRTETPYFSVLRPPFSCAVV